LAHLLTVHKSAALVLRPILDHNSARIPGGAVPYLRRDGALQSMKPWHRRIIIRQRGRKNSMMENLSPEFLVQGLIWYVVFLFSMFEPHAPYSLMRKIRGRMSSSGVDSQYFSKIV